MCGIVGYSGNETKAKEVILSGLEKLEYRGYDSAGIAIVMENQELFIEKKKGKLAVLKEYVEKDSKLEGKIGIGHTRWATHGIPTDENAHPHYGQNKKVAVVHNGIIENYWKIKEELVKEGVQFSSDTDTEVVAQLFEKLYQGDLLEATLLLLEKIKGSYALGMIHQAEPTRLVCCKKESPLVIGIGETASYIASDATALLKYTKNFIYLEDGDIAILEGNQVKLYDRLGKEITREVVYVDASPEQVSKQGYEHFMLKEMEEQGDIIEKTLGVYVNEEGNVNFQKQVAGISLENFHKIYVVACGTAYHAGLQLQYFMKHLCQKEIIVDIASEFRHDPPFLDEKTLVIVISQSGETYDTLMALRQAKLQGAMTLAICNVLGSTIAREADRVIYTLAGPEISVASTKAYTAQVVLLYLLTLYFSGKNEKELDDAYQLSEKFKHIFDKKEEIKRVSEKIAKSKDIFYLGRGLDEKIAREGSLKLKEITYIHSESFPIGELKHGSIALIEEGVPVVLLSTRKEWSEKSSSNLKEVKSRGAYVIAIAVEGSDEVKAGADEYIEIEDAGIYLTALLAVVKMQLLAYYVAVAKGLDVDKPRNLAKSVTVE
ncbi:glutamine--fructose-6-phosphate transaminase (isomerizing) [Fusobacterium gonidiaformans]|uniref:glutamine--fructose-6-phosphate transaminase (isomerizing) n=1 Tax=Fusobacterium gonidiaformans TaxID=849 RepID=UPI0001BC656F|nr:glutamine--fructose-6-phosphate transaminase (isomerizing) [Fusobacterium gonidiaformans]AVQ16861.1 glutamine--fructose-6-phosphate transaminase (isomerizing) [Fusobacterium gonidiaformans ATCC 25563]EFS28445.1 glutamine-fructose-6-phosphate transaminase (isomerizing) [Fusobacterium gonidiaformans ATCC 25563]